MSSTTLSQISCYSSINRKLKLNIRKPSIVIHPMRFKFSVGTHLEGSGTEISTSETKTTLSSTADASKSQLEGAVKSYSSAEEEPLAQNLGTDVLEHNLGVPPPKKAAKIHDFCFGIPFGGLVLSGGLVGFLFSRNPTSVSSVLYGGGLLALSTFSLKVWRQGKSSLPYILGQAALSAALLWKHFQNYTLTKKLFPVGFYAVVSAGMLCFYSYVLASGGNPPPKKMKLATNPSS